MTRNFWRYRVTVAVDTLGSFYRETRATSAQEAAGIALVGMGDSMDGSLPLDVWLNKQPITVTVECLQIAEFVEATTLKLPAGVSGGPISEGRPVTADDLVVEAARTEAPPPDLTKVGGLTCRACLAPWPGGVLGCPGSPRFPFQRWGDTFTPEQRENVERWWACQPSTAVCSHPCPKVCRDEDCGAQWEPIGATP